MHQGIFFTHILSQSNIYNYYTRPIISGLELLVQVSMFVEDRNERITKVLKLLMSIASKRVFFKRYTFRFIRKQILRVYFFSVNLRKYFLSKFLCYFVDYYLYFYNIYYKSKMKYNYNATCFYFYVDNLHSLLFKGSNKLNKKTQFKVIFHKDKNSTTSEFLGLLSCNRLLNIK